MEEERYQVIVTAVGNAAASYWPAIQSFARLFSISEVDALIRLDSVPCVVRGSLSLEQAEKYCRVMQRGGINCECKRESCKNRDEVRGWL